MIVKGRDEPVVNVTADANGIKIRVDFILRPDAWVEISLTDTDIETAKLERDQQEEREQKEKLRPIMTAGLLSALGVLSEEDRAKVTAELRKMAGKD